MPPSACDINALFTLRSNKIILQRREVFGRANILDRHAEKFFSRVTVVMHSRIIHSQKSECVEVVDPHRERAALKQKPVALLTGLEFSSPRLDFQFDALMAGFQARLALGDAPHLALALDTGNGQKTDFKDDPARVLQPSPRAGREDSVNRLWPVNPAQEMVSSDDRRGCDEHPP